MNHNLESMLTVAVDLVEQAGRITLDGFNKGVAVQFKGDDSPVTETDRATEAFMRKEIAARYPDHAVLGEEAGQTGPEHASHRWIMDPIDGTKSFMRGIPLYSVLLGLEIDGRIELGVAGFPALGEILYAASDLGCRLNGKPVCVSQEDRLDRAFVSYTDPGLFEKFGKAPALARVFSSSYYNPGLPDAYGHALVATGRCEIMLDAIMNPWDCGPFPVILREAGGWFGDWSGEETIYGGNAVSTNGALRDQVLDLIRERVTE